MACRVFLDLEQLRGRLQLVVHVLVDLEDLVVILQAGDAVLYRVVIHINTVDLQSCQLIQSLFNLFSAKWMRTHETTLALFGEALEALLSLLELRVLRLLAADEVGARGGREAREQTVHLLVP